VLERVVFDTNIWISGLLWRGKPYQSLLLARGKAVQVVSRLFSFDGRLVQYGGSANPARRLTPCRWAALPTGQVGEGTGKSKMEGCR